jgi:hypothetical protein
MPARCRVITQEYKLDRYTVDHPDGGKLLTLRVGGATDRVY